MGQDCFGVHLRRRRSYFSDYSLQILLLDPNMRTSPRILRKLVARRLKIPKTPPLHHHKSEKKHSPHQRLRRNSPHPRLDQRNRLPNRCRLPLFRAVAMNRMSLRVSERLQESKNTEALLATFNESDISPIVEMRAKFRAQILKEHNNKLGFMSASARASVLSLKEIPAANTSIEGGSIIYRDGASRLQRPRVSSHLCCGM